MHRNPILRLLIINIDIVCIVMNCKDGQPFEKKTQAWSTPNFQFSNILVTINNEM